MQKETINNKTKSVLEKLSKSKAFENFYMAGGTALALQLGHRESIDLDWFSSEKFFNDRLKMTISDLGDFSLEEEEENTLHGVLDEVKITFLYYNYDLLFPTLDLEGVKLADERDIAAMKLSAISSRGTKKDFIDLFFLLQKYSLEDVLNFFEKKYSNIKYNKAHLLKSLVYFEDAENDPMPIMKENVEWENVKKNIEEKINKIIEL